MEMVQKASKRLRSIIEDRVVLNRENRDVTSRHSSPIGGKRTSPPPLRAASPLVLAAAITSRTGPESASSLRPLQAAALATLEPVLIRSSDPHSSRPNLVIWASRLSSLTYLSVAINFADRSNLQVNHFFFLLKIRYSFCLYTKPPKRSIDTEWVIVCEFLIRNVSLFV